MLALPGLLCQSGSPALLLRCRYRSRRSSCPESSVAANFAVKVVGAAILYRPGRDRGLVQAEVAAGAGLDGPVD